MSDRSTGLRLCRCPTKPSGLQPLNLLAAKSESSGSWREWPAFGLEGSRQIVACTENPEDAPGSYQVQIGTVQPRVSAGNIIAPCDDTAVALGSHDRTQLRPQNHGSSATCFGGVGCVLAWLPRACHLSNAAPAGMGKCQPCCGEGLRRPRQSQPRTRRPQAPPGSLERGVGSHGPTSAYCKYFLAISPQGGNPI